MDVKSHLSGAIITSALVMLATGIGSGSRPLLLMLWGCACSFLPSIGQIGEGKQRLAATHSFVFAGIVAVIIFFLGHVVDFGALAPYFSATGASLAFFCICSHIVMDSFTTSGVAFFYPLLSRRHQHFPYFGPRLRYADNYSNHLLVYLGLITVILITAVELIMLI